MGFKMGIRGKLIGSFFIVIALLGVISAYSVNTMENIETHVKQIDQEWLPSAIDVGDMKASVWNADDVVGRYAMETSVTQRMKLKGELNSVLSEAQQRQSAYLSIISGNAKNHRLEVTAYSAFAADWKNYLRQMPAILQTSDQGNQAKAIQLFKNTSGVFDRIRADLTRLVSLNEQGAKGSSHDVVQLVDSSRILILIISVIAIILGIGISWLLSSKMSKAIRSVRDLSVKIADGDLRVPELNPRSKDEIADLGHATNEMVKHLKHLIGGIRETSERVTAASEELSVGAKETVAATNQVALSAQDVAEGATRQVYAADDSAKAVEDMAMGIQRIAETSSVVAQASTMTTEAAEEGNRSSQRAVQQMQTINRSVSDSATQMTAMQEQSKQIGNIIGVMTELAGQTNLLALNAAIEAARAGEHGRGFAVVAEEVRELSVQSKNSAQQVISIIESMMENTNLLVVNMAKVVTDANTGVAVISEAGQAFENILESARSVADQIMEVSAVSEEMAASGQEVAASIENMASISRESSAQVQTVSAATEEQLASMDEIMASANSLSEMAQDLLELISEFKL